MTYEIRFNCSKELKDSVVTLHQKGFSDIVKTRFYEKVFLLGWFDLMTQLTKLSDEDMKIKLLKLRK
ncbi:hypothetical protein M0R19_01970 [Candidatus Pacearchaeota archaeon]|nr:hypothetical protein [Candidatus Pacearchaeota archaeon]